MKIAIYGGGNQATEIIKLINRHSIPVTIEKIILTNPNCNEFMGIEVISVERINDIYVDYLVISSDKYYKEMFFQLKKNSQSWDSLAPKIVDFERIQRMLYNLKRDMPYMSVRVNDINLVYRSDDIEIPYRMFCNGNIYSKETMDAFAELVTKYSSKTFDTGYFFDIGANIGTTTVYFGKKYPKMKVLAFEPSRENARLLKINCILNDLLNVQVEEVGVSSEQQTLPFKYNSANSGNSGFTDKISDYSYLANVVSIDQYCFDRNIFAKDICALWVDVEGYEYNVILGAKKLIESERIPLLQEFNPSIYQERGVLEEYLQLMEELFHGYVSLIDDEKRYRNISELRDYPKKLEDAGYTHVDIFFY